MARMKQIYREKWTAKLSSTKEYEETKADYGYFLAKMTPEQIKAGLEACEKQMEWPPVPGDFYKAGLKGAKQHPAHRDFLKLPKPVVDREKGIEACVEMRNKINRAGG